MPPVGTKRLFIALELPASAVDELARVQARLEGSAADVTWVAPPSQIHITLKFLGDTPSDRIPLIQETLERLGHSHLAIHAALGPLDAFPSVHAPQVLWAALTDPDNRLSDLARAIEEALSPLGHPLETRPFTVHATLGRVRSGKNRAALIRALEMEKVEPLPLVLDKVTLYESTLTEKGPIYTALCRITLK